MHFNCKGVKRFLPKDFFKLWGFVKHDHEGYYDAGLWKINPQYIIKGDYVLFTVNLTLANFDE